MNINIVEKLENMNLPSSLKRVRFNIGDFYYRQRFKQSFLESARKLESMHNLHNTDRCFLMGTGPSLNNTNLSLIKNEIIFGVNTLYKGLSKFNIKSKYYVVGDPVIFNAHTQNLLNLKTTLFLSGYAGRRFLESNSLTSQNENVIFLHPLFEGDDLFSKNILQGVCYGGTVIFLALQIIFYLGFKEVYLLGCDCDYSGLHRFDGSKTENLVGMAIGETEKVFSSYKVCKKIFEEDNRKIYNATVGGKLEVFERKSLEELVL